MCASSRMVHAFARSFVFFFSFIWVTNLFLLQATADFPSRTSSPSSTPALACPTVLCTSRQLGVWSSPSSTSDRPPPSTPFSVLRTFFSRPLRPTSIVLVCARAHSLFFHSVVMLNLSYIVPVLLILIRGRGLLRPESFPAPTWTLGPILGPIAK
jgi:hypothetical protein